MNIWSKRYGPIAKYSIRWALYTTYPIYLFHYSQYSGYLLLLCITKYIWLLKDVWILMHACMYCITNNQIEFSSTHCQIWEEWLLFDLKLILNAKHFILLRLESRKTHIHKFSQSMCFYIPILLSSLYNIEVQCVRIQIKDMCKSADIWFNILNICFKLTLFVHKYNNIWRSLFTNNRTSALKFDSISFN